MALGAGQDPRFRMRCGPWLCTAIRSTNVMLLKPGFEVAFFTPSEIGYSQGWPSIKLPTTEKYQRAMGFDLSSLTAREQQLLQGNAMHLTCVASFMVHVFSNTLRRSTAREYLPDIRILARAHLSQKARESRAIQQDATCIMAIEIDGEENRKVSIPFQRNGPCGVSTHLRFNGRTASFLNT